MYKSWYNILHVTPLFKGFDVDELDTLLQCIGGDIKKIAKGEIALLAGDKITQIGIVLSGKLHIFSECLEGKRSLTASLMPGDLYGGALCCADVDESPVSIMAKSDSDVLMLDFPHALNSCTNTCDFHGTLIENMLKIVAKKNFHLQNRMEIVSLYSVRAKVLHYLESFVPKQGQNIVIPFNREELANYLCVERSALSHELARMKADNLIDYRKNQFCLKTCSLHSRLRKRKAAKQCPSTTEEV